MQLSWLHQLWLHQLQTTLQLSSIRIGAQVSRDEEELANKRLEVKTGLPLQDLTGKRVFPEDPRVAANQQLQAEVCTKKEAAQTQNVCQLLKQNRVWLASQPLPHCSADKVASCDAACMLVNTASL